LIGSEIGPPKNIIDEVFPISKTNTLPEINYSLPIAKISVKGLNGQNKIISLNFHHSIADLRDLVIAEFPHTPIGFKLILTFPRKILSDLTHTIDLEKLDNSVVLITK